MTLVLPRVPADVFFGDGAAERQATVTGAGTPVPVFYGTDRVGAHIIAVGLIGTDLVLGCAWGLGPVDSIEDLTINGQAPPDSVTVTHYLGFTDQQVDATLAEAISGYSDTLVSVIRGILCALTYSVVRIPRGAITGFPRIESVVTGKPLLNLTHNGSGELGTAEGWISPFAVDGEGLVVQGGNTRAQHQTYRMPVDINAAYRVSIMAKTSIPDRSFSSFLVCEDDIHIAGGGGHTVRDRSNWTPARNTTLSSPVTAGANTVQINEPSAEWTAPGTHTMMLFDIPAGEDPDPAVIATEGHVITNIEDLGGGVWEITLATNLRESWPAGTLVSNGLRTSQNNVPDLFGGLVTPGDDWERYRDIHSGADPLFDTNLPAVRTTFRRGTKYVRWAFESIDADVFLHLKEITLSPLRGENPARALADFVASPLYGQGLSVEPESIEAAAAANDEALSDGSPRRKIALTIARPAPCAQWVDMMRGYAGCFVVRRGDTVRLVPDRPGDPVASITDADIVGGSLRLSKRPMRHAPTVVRVRYTDATSTPRRDMDALAYAPGVLEGLVPWREETIDQPGIDTYAQALREATERLNVGQLTDLDAEWLAYDEALVYEEGDIILMTHPIGLADKALRILLVERHGPGRWRIQAAEYSAEVYSDTVGAGPGADSPIASPSSISPVTDVAAASGTVHLLELSDGTIMSRMLVTWTPPADAYYRDARVRYRKATDAQWTFAPAGEASTYCAPVQDGVNYLVEVQAVNSFGVESAWTAIAHVVVGKTEPPPPPTQFLYEGDADGTRRFTLTPPSPLPLDVKSGGGYQIRYRLGTGHEWPDMTPLHHGKLVNLPYETNQLAAGTYTFAAATIDSTDHVSTPIYITATLGDPRLAGALEVQQSHTTGWPGVKTNCWIDPLSGWLVASDTKDWSDFATDGDDWSDWTSWAREPATMVYEAEVIDAGLVTRFTPLISGEYEGTATIEVQTSDDGETWSGWAAPAGQVQARYVQARITLVPIDAGFTALKAMTMILDAEVISEDLNDRDTSTFTGPYRIAVGDIRLPITKEYGAIRKVDIALQNVGPGWSWEVIDKDNTVGPRIRIYNGSDTLADAVIDATIRGV